MANRAESMNIRFPPSTLLRPGSLRGRMQTNEHRRNASIFLSIRRGSGRQQSQGRQRHGQRPRSRRNSAGGPWWLDETVTTTETATVGRRSAIRPVGKHLQAHVAHLVLVALGALDERTEVDAAESRLFEQSNSTQVEKQTPCASPSLPVSARDTHTRARVHTASCIAVGDPKNPWPTD
jgi:hypothetical protein